MNSSDNLFYKLALENSGKVQSDPIGLSSFKPTAKTDETVIKQNNTIIELLISLSHKIAETSERLDQLSIKIDKLQEDKALEELTSRVNQISIASTTGHLEPKGRKRPLQSHTFHYNIFGSSDKGKKPEDSQTAQPSASETKK